VEPGHASLSLKPFAVIGRTVSVAKPRRAIETELLIFHIKKTGQAFYRLPWSLGFESNLIWHTYPIDAIFWTQDDRGTQLMPAGVVTEGGQADNTGAPRFYNIPGRWNSATIFIRKTICKHGQDGIRDRIPQRDRYRPKGHAACIFQFEFHPPATAAGFQALIRDCEGRHWRGGRRDRGRGWRGEYGQHRRVSGQYGKLAPKPAESTWLIGIADIPVIPHRVSADHLGHLVD